MLIPTLSLVGGIPVRTVPRSDERILPDGTGCVKIEFEKKRRVPKIFSGKRKVRNFAGNAGIFREAEDAGALSEEVTPRFRRAFFSWRATFR